MKARLAVVGSFAAAAFAGALSGPSCTNPVVDDQVELFGDELPDVGTTEFHRPGQPCVLCHSVYGGASPELVIGGTVFADQRSFLPVENVEIKVYDAVGDIYTMTSNCIGNFFLPAEGKLPQFPLAVEIRCPQFDADGQPLEGQKVRNMNSWIGRDGSCATCHSLRGTEVDSTGWIFCNDVTEVETNVYPPVPDDCAGRAPQAANEGDL